LSFLKLFSSVGCSEREKKTYIFIFFFCKLFLIFFVFF
jgi:hypothetical protein